MNKQSQIKEFDCQKLANDVLMALVRSTTSWCEIYFYMNCIKFKELK